MPKSKHPEAATIVIRHKESGTRQEVGVTAWEAGEYPDWEEVERKTLEPGLTLNEKNTAEPKDAA